MPPLFRAIDVFIRHFFPLSLPPLSLLRFLFAYAFRCATPLLFLPRQLCLLFFAMMPLMLITYAADITLRHY